MQGCVLRPLCQTTHGTDRDYEVTAEKHFRRSNPVWWAWPDLNLGPHPYQLDAGNRCADRPFPRSPPTVGAKGMRSNGPLVCVLSDLVRAVQASHCRSSRARVRPHCASRSATALQMEPVKGIAPAAVVKGPSACGPRHLGAATSLLERWLKRSPCRSWPCRPRSHAGSGPRMNRQPLVSCGRSRSGSTQSRTHRQPAAFRSRA